LLLGHPDGAHAPLADLFEQLVGADDVAHCFAGQGNGRVGGPGSERSSPRRNLGRLFQEATGPKMRGQQFVHLCPQCLVVATGNGDVGSAIGLRGDL
jgi:hypothetical protein